MASEDDIPMICPDFAGGAEGALRDLRIPGDSANFLSAESAGGLARAKRSSWGCEAAWYGRFANLGADGTPCTLGIMGGTFDPIHAGHLAIARAACKELGLSGVLFVVAGDPWMKHGRSITPAEHRFAMVQTAIAGDARFGASRMEIDRAGETYTADTLRQLRAHFPENVRLVFLLGADALQHLPEWHDAGSLGSLATFAVASRAGERPIDARVLKRAAEAIGAREIPHFAMPPIEVSSTDLREKLRCGLPTCEMLPPVVADYIKTHGLYREARAAEHDARSDTNGQGQAKEK